LQAQEEPDISFQFDIPVEEGGARVHAAIYEVEKPADRASK
jgi:hypothetical protein